MGPPWNYRSFAGVSKIEAQSKLQLPRVRSRSKAERFGWRCGTVAVCAGSTQKDSLFIRQTAHHVIDARKVRPVEDVKSFKRQLKKHRLFEGKAARDAGVETIKGLADAGVTTDAERTIRLRAAIVVGIKAKQQIERATGTGCEDGRENPIRQQLFTKRVAFNAAGEYTTDNGAMSLVKRRECAIEPQVKGVLCREVAVEVCDFVD